MIAGNPIRWNDPATWPWMFWIWAAFALAGLAKPAWSWLRRKRAAGWPVAEGRIESVEITKPSFSFTTKRGYYVAELGYSYSVAGTLNSGRYKREFPTEREANEFVRDLTSEPTPNWSHPPGKHESQPHVEHPRPRCWISPSEWRCCEHRPHLNRIVREKKVVRYAHTMTP